MMRVWHISFYVDSVAKQIRKYCVSTRLTIIKTAQVKLISPVAPATERGRLSIAKLLVGKYLPLNLYKNMIERIRKEGGRGINANTLVLNLAKFAEWRERISTTQTSQNPLMLFGFADYTIEKLTQIRYNMANAQTANNGRFLLRNKIC